MRASSLLLKYLQDGRLKTSSLKTSPSPKNSTINSSYELERKHCLAKIINRDNNHYHIKHISDLRKCSNVPAETGKKLDNKP